MGVGHVDPYEDPWVYIALPSPDEYDLTVDRDPEIKLMGVHTVFTVDAMASCFFRFSMLARLRGSLLQRRQFFLRLNESPLGIYTLVTQGRIVCRQFIVEFGS